MASGDYHCLALKFDGSVWAWGDNGGGQLGDGTYTDHWTPVQVSGLSDIVAIAAGHAHNLALQRNGNVWAWGINEDGQLGDGNTLTKSNTPVLVRDSFVNQILSGVTQITAGYDSSLALKADGTVYAWGSNIYGQLGDGTTTDHASALQVPGLTNVVNIAGKGFHYLARTAPTTTVSGTIALEGIVPNAEPQPIQFLFRSLTNGGILPRVVDVQPNGAFSLSHIPFDTYSVRTKGYKYLSTAVLTDTSEGSVSGVVVPLRAGDANNDNSVDTLDLDILIQAFDMVFGSPAFDSSADFNGDLSVDVLDLALLLGNFDMQGDS